MEIGDLEDTGDGQMGEFNGYNSQSHNRLNQFKKNLFWQNYNHNLNLINLIYYKISNKTIKSF